MHCPNCATKAIKDQRYCRNCGANLGAIWDVMEGRRGESSVDNFEKIKGDLYELGKNLRAGFEQAKENFNKHTNPLNAQMAQPPQAKPVPVPPAPLAAPPPEVIRDLRRTIRALRRMINKVKAANTRKYSLQQAMLKMFGGGASLVAWFYFLQRAGNSGLLNSLEQILLQKTGWQIYGLVPVIQMLWVFALIPVAVGLAHLINGVFFAPKQAELDAELEEASPTYQMPVFSYQPQPYAVPPVAATPSAISTNELERDANSIPAGQPAGASVTEDATLRFEQKGNN